MRVALIHCPFEHRPFSENIQVVDKEFCLAPPIILAYVAAIIERAGHTVTIIDANALRLSKEQALKSIQRFQADIIAFRADTYWFHRTVEWASFFKERTAATILVGGINVSLYPQESLAYRCFDYGIIGEAFRSLPLLLSGLEKGLAPHQVPGLAYRSEGAVRCNPPDAEPVKFDEYPFPARHLLPNHRYSSFTSQRKNFTIVLTNTGCPYSCLFCAIHKQPFRLRSAQNVADEIEECCRSFHIREIDFFSASFFIDKALAMGICDEILKRKLRVEWSCRSRVDEVDEECLQKAFAAGCRKIYYGIESASPSILSNISKNTDPKRIRHAIEQTRKAGIATLGFFMIGAPGETRESINASIQFAQELKLDYVQVCRMIAKPNTCLTDQLVQHAGSDPWREYILDQHCAPDALTPWTSFSKAELLQEIKRFYREFYFRPSYLVRRISRTRSWSELARYVSVAAKFLFQSV